MQGDFRGHLFNDLVELTGDRNVIEKMLEGLMHDWPDGRTGAWDLHVGDKLKKAAKRRPGSARKAAQLESELRSVFMGGSSSDCVKRMKEAFR